MKDILTITLNPALDLATTTPKIEAGPKLRCAEPELDPGGGGINVSRAIHILGGASRAFVAVGGPTGQRVTSLLKDEGVEALRFEVPGDTRQSIAVTATDTGEQFRFVLPGPHWDAGLLTPLLDRIVDAASPAGLAVLSGSNPPGIPDDIAITLCAHLKARNVSLIADMSGSSLHQLATMAASPLYVLRLDQKEAETLAGRALLSRQDSADFAAELVRRGVAEIVIVGRAADGSVLASASERVHAATPKVPVRSKIGAGDSFVGALALSLARGEDHAQALCSGVAAASAAVISDATNLCRREDFDALMKQCVVTFID